MTSTKPLSFWAIRQRSTGFWLPPLKSGYRRGGTWLEPGLRPRLFRRRQDARACLAEWLQGQRSVYIAISDTPNGRDEWEEVSYNPVPSRKADDMEIVELRLTEVITQVTLINPEDFFASLPGDQSEPSNDAK